MSVRPTKIAMALAVALSFGFTYKAEAGWPKVKVTPPRVNVSPPKIKVGPLGPYQQKVAARGLGGVVGAGVTVATTPAIGPYGAAAAGAVVGTGVGNHAEKKWTGRGLESWRQPNRW